MMTPAFEALPHSSVILSFESSSCNDLHSCRTLWNIVWGSLITLFACVWLSVHPNIPAPEDSWGTRAARRVWIMVMALLAPELIVGWAARQWILASEISGENEEYGWTKTHGFFVVMGGFMKCDEDDRPVSTVTFDDVGSIPEKIKRRVQEADIKDRSKGDVLSKSFAVLQTGWFIVQCISRTIEGLPVTELEIATGAFCALNLVTYILWWNKPLNVSRPVRVYACEREAEGAEEGPGRAEEGHTRVLWGAFNRDIPREVYRPIAAMVEEYGVWETIALFPFIVFEPILHGESFGSNSNPRRVATFSPKHPVSNLNNRVGAAVVGVVFGAIHCTAWSSQFPSQTEQLLWRVAAISVTGVPLLMLLIFSVNASGFFEFSRSDSYSGVLMVFAVMLAIPLYVFARLTLLVLPFMSLRSLPPGAFNTVDWIGFIPHT